MTPIMVPSPHIASSRRPPRVRLLGTVPAEQRVSMDTYARHLSAALHDLGVSAHLHVPPHDHAAHAAARYWRRYVRYQLSARALDADVNHVIDHGYGHLVFSLDAARTVVTFHDAMLLKLAERSLPTTFRPRLTIAAHRVSLAGIARAARVIAVSQSARADLLSHTTITPERVVVVPEGVDSRFFGDSAPVAVRQMGRVQAKASTRTILHVGSCGFYKNIETILHALPAAMRLLGEPITFLKAGAPFTPAQEALIAHLAIEGHVRHCGFVPDADLPSLYRSADALVFPSLYEGFGLPVLEAMASGTPVITSHAGALPELVGDVGIMVDPTDRDGLATVISHVLGDSALHADLARRGVQRARGFSWHQTAHRTLRVYQEVLDEAGPRKTRGRRPQTTHRSTGYVVVQW